MIDKLSECIVEALKAMKIQSSTSIFIHCDAMVVGQFPGLGNKNGFEIFFSTLESYLSPLGTLIVPTFSYSLTKGEIFDVQRTPSSVGMMTEYFRGRPGVRRTKEPIFSVAVSGNRSREIAQLTTKNCFDDNSIFGWLAKNKAHVVGFGVNPNSITFTHYVEQLIGVDYRYFKLFKGKVVGTNNKEVDCELKYYARDLDSSLELNLINLVSKMKEEQVWFETKIKRVGIWSFKCEDFIRVLKENLPKNPNLLMN